MAQGLRVIGEGNKPQHAANRRFPQAGFRGLEYEKIQIHIISPSIAMRRFLRPIPLAISALTLLLVYTLVGFFLVPHIIKAHVLPAVSDQLRHPVTAKEVEFNPFVLSLRMTEFEIQEEDTTPIVGFQEFFINFQTSSLFRGAYVFDEIRFALPYVSIKVGKDGHDQVESRLNIAAGS